MTIIVCNDRRSETDIVSRIVTAKTGGKPWNAAVRGRLREEVNMDRMLCDKLRRLKGHIPVVFDGYDDTLVAKIQDVPLLAKGLVQLIMDHEALGMVYDLHYGGRPNQFDVGVAVLRELKRLQGIPRDMKIVVYSSFLYEPEKQFPSILTGEFGISPENILDRNRDRIDVVVNKFPAR